MTNMVVNFNELAKEYLTDNPDKKNSDSVRNRGFEAIYLQFEPEIGEGPMTNAHDDWNKGWADWFAEEDDYQEEIELQRRAEIQEEAENRMIPHLKQQIDILEGIYSLAKEMSEGRKENKKLYQEIIASKTLVTRKAAKLYFQFVDYNKWDVSVLRQGEDERFYPVVSQSSKKRIEKIASKMSFKMDTMIAYFVSLDWREE